jgi:Zn-finger nucleic acid-binding protein
MNCPICHVALHISERQGIEVDYCPQCRGVWLDRGELDKIIERAAAETPAYAPPREQRREYPAESYRPDHSRPHEDDDYYRRRKKKSLLGELFDFD